MLRLTVSRAFMLSSIIPTFGELSCKNALISCFLDTVTDLLSWEIWVKLRTRIKCRKTILSHAKKDIFRLYFELIQDCI